MGYLEEVEELKYEIRKTVDANNRAKLQTLLSQALNFCETIKKTLETASEKDRKELNAVMKDFKVFLNKEMGRLAKKMGLTEDELAHFNENPENFSKDQWLVMNALKQRFHQQAKEIRKVVKAHSPRTKKGSDDTSKASIPHDWKEQIENNPKILKITPSLSDLPQLPFTQKKPEKKKPIKSKRKRVRKSKWVKT